MRTLGVAALIVWWLLLCGLSICLWSGDVRYSLMIDHRLVYGESVELQPLNEGLTGAELTMVRPNPLDPDQLVVQGAGGNYLSMDGGENWTPLTVADERYAEVPLRWDSDGYLVALYLNHLYRTRDGHTWEGGWLDLGLQALGRTSEGRIWLLKRQRTQPDEYLWLTWSDGQPLAERAEERPEDDGSARSLQIVLPSQADADSLPLEARVTEDARGGQWAATARGVFYRSGPEGEWTDRNTGIHQPNIIALHQHPDQASRLLARDSAGRLWRSDDFAGHWRIESQGPITIARFGHGEYSLLMAEGHSRVHGVTQEGVVQQLLDEDALKYHVCELARQAMLERPDLYGAQESLLAVDCRSLPQESPDPQAGVTQQLSEPEIQAIIQRAHLVRRTNTDLASLRLCVLDERGDGTIRLWFYRYGCPAQDRRSVPREGLVILEYREGGWHRVNPASILEPEAVGEGESCSFDILDRDAYTRRAGSLYPVETAFMLLDLPATGVVLGSDRYLAIGAHGVQIGRLDDACRQTGDNVVYHWSYRSHRNGIRYPLLYPDQAAWSVENGRIELAIPSRSGLWSVQVPLEPMLSWRRLLFKLRRTHLIWLLWAGTIALTAAVWIRRRDRQVPTD